MNEWKIWKLTRVQGDNPSTKQYFRIVAALFNYRPGYDYKNGISSLKNGLVPGISLFNATGYPYQQLIWSSSITQWVLIHVKMSKEKK